MTGRLRKLKAALTLGGIWGVGATLLSGAAYALIRLVTTGSIPVDAVLESALQYGVFGLAVGTAFAGTLVWFEDRDILGRMRMWRIALWGAVMGGSFPLIIEVLEGGATLASLSAMTGMTAFAALVGAGLSTGTILLAKEAKGEIAPPPGPDALAATSEHPSA